MHLHEPTKSGFANTAKTIGAAIWLMLLAFLQPAAAHAATVQVRYDANGGTVGSNWELGTFFTSAPYTIVPKGTTAANVETASLLSTFTVGTTGYNLRDYSTFGLAKTGYHIDSGKEYYTYKNNSKLAADKVEISQSQNYTGNQWKGWASEPSSGSGYWYTRVYANWKANTWYVKYNGNGSTAGSMSNSTHTYDTAKTLTANAYSRAYTVTYNHNYSGSTNTSAKATYTFAGWNTNSSGTGTNYSNSQSVKNITATNGGTVNLYAKWTSSSVTLPTPTRTGYSFGGWYGESSCTNKVGNGGVKYTPTANKTLYAKWTANTYTVSYNANGGSGAPSSQTKTYGITLTLSSTKPTKTGYSFLGWSTSSTATTATYSAGGSYTANAGATLYAVWKANTYTVSYDANSGSGAPSSQTKTYGVALTLSSTKPTRTGYTFQGWATSSDGAVAYQPGGSYTANAAVTLYAKWTANTYTISYSLGTDGEHGNNHPTSATYNSTFTVSNPERTGYTFTGWKITGMDSVTHSYGDSTDNMSTTTNTSISSTKATKYKNLRATSGTVTFTAQWTPNTYAVSYALDGGRFTHGYDAVVDDDTYSRLYNPTSVKYDNSGYAVSSGKTRLSWFYVDKPTRTGYTFSGWKITGMDTTEHDFYYDSETHTTSATSFNTSGLSNVSPPSRHLRATSGTVTFTAQWTPNTYAISYVLSGGSFESGYDTTYDYGDYTYLCNPTSVKYDNSGYTVNSGKNRNPWFNVEKPEKTGYSFKGWTITGMDSTEHGFYYDGGAHTVTATSYDTAGLSNTSPLARRLRATSGTVTYTAQWEDAQYIVKFNANGGDGSMTDQTINIGTSTALKANAFTKYNYTFKGWNTKANGTGTSYANKQQVLNLSTSYTTPVTLYAQWKENTNISVDGDYIYVDLPANSELTLNGIPAGTEYEVEELTPAGWAVVSSSNTTGVIQPNVTETTSYKNQQSSYGWPVVANLRAYKKVDGSYDIPANAYTFVLEKEDGTMLQTAKNSANGVVAFSSLSFNATGTYKYKIRELAGNGDIAYDSHVYTATVKVTGSGSSHTVTVSYSTSDGEPPIFENNHEFGRLTISKTITQPAKTVFSFNVRLTKDGTELPAGVYGTDAYGNDIVFGGGFSERNLTIPIDSTTTGSATASITLQNLPVGTVYEVREVTDDGWKLDSSQGANGVITSGSTSLASFVNTINIPEPSSVLFNLELEKRLENRTLKDGEFSFELLNADGTPVMQDGNAVIGKNDVNGNIEFSGFYFDEPGEYEYIVKEIDTGDRTVEYDLEQRRVRINVVYDGITQTLAVDHIDMLEGNAVFTNVAKPGELTVKKTLDADAPNTNSTFRFRIDYTLPDDADRSNITIDSGTEFELRAGESWSIALPHGTAYTVTELGVSTTPSAGNWWIEEPVRTGQIDWERAQIETFENHYQTTATWSPTVTKQASGFQLEADQFEFELIDVDSESVIQTAPNDSAGNVSFDGIDFTYQDLGTERRFAVREIVKQDDNILYDTHTAYFSVTPQDDDRDGEIDFDVESNTVDAVFTNRVKTSSLIVSKEVVGNCPPDAVFLFDILYRPVGSDDEYQTLQVELSDGESAEFELPDDSEYIVREVSVKYGENGEYADIVSGGWMPDENELTGITDTDEASTAAFINSYSAAGSWMPTVTKVTEGFGLEDEVFTFELIDADTEETIGIATNIGGTVTFSPIGFSYEDVGETRKFIVREKIGEDAAIEYDTHNITFDVTAYEQIVGSGDLQFNVIASEPNPTFTNRYRVGTLSVSKTVEQGSPTDGTFRFQIDYTLPSSVDESAASALGMISIESGSIFELEVGESLEIRLPYGTEYTISELDVAESGDGWTTEKMNVTDTVDSASKEIRFENKYSASGEWAPTVTKKVEGFTLEEGQFEFALIDRNNDEIIEKATNDAKGNIEFDTIHFSYSDIGTTHRFDVVEIPGDESEIVYDRHSISYMVTPRNVNNGELEFVVTSTGSPIFTNYKKTNIPETRVLPSVGTLRVSKSLTDAFAGASADQDFDFTLTVYTMEEDGTKTPISGTLSCEGAYSEDIILDDNGQAMFSLNGGEQIIFTLPADVNYEVSEAQVPGFSLVSEEGSAGVIADGVESVASFENEYSASGTASIVAKKIVESTTGDTDVPDHGFGFALYDGDGHAWYARNDANGDVAFPEIVYTEPGTYTYTIAEVQPGTAEAAAVDSAYLSENSGGSVEWKDPTADHTAVQDAAGVAHGATAFETLIALVSANGGEIPTEYSSAFAIGASSGSSIEWADESADHSAARTAAEVAADASASETYFALVSNHADMSLYGGEFSISDGTSYPDLDVNSLFYEYDTHTEQVTVEVVDNGDGTLTATPSYQKTEGVSFTNEKKDIVITGVEEMMQKASQVALFAFPIAFAGSLLFALAHRFTEKRK